jgi:hypothetical protein
MCSVVPRPGVLGIAGSQAACLHALQLCRGLPADCVTRAGPNDSPHTCAHASTKYITPAPASKVKLCRAGLTLWITITPHTATPAAPYKHRGLGTQTPTAMVGGTTHQVHSYKSRNSMNTRQHTHVCTSNPLPLTHSHPINAVGLGSMTAHKGPIHPSAVRQPPRPTHTTSCQNTHRDKHARLHVITHAERKKDKHTRTRPHVTTHTHTPRGSGPVVVAQDASHGCCQLLK